MSLMKTLAKVAIGVAVAKGVSTLAKGSQSGRIGTGGATGGATGRGAGGGLEDMMGSILGNGRAKGAGMATAGGSIGELLNELGGAGQTTRGTPRTTTRAGQPDLGAILGQLTGGSAGGGLGGMLGQLASAGAAGGLGGLLGGMLSGQGGGLGGALDQALRNGGEPDAAPAPEQELAAAVLLKAMIQAAKADGQIDANEQARLMDKLGDVSAEERAFVQAELQAPVDPEGLAKLVPAGLESQAYMMSLMAIDLDNQAEAQYLDRLARALGLQPAEVNGIHDRLGVPQLYA
ncbi:DUF533 domain-containing protein [Paenirhodobacter populi]|uniref:Tellurite resistance TerB family protein n=1 Tax=Paenirhodobacter populi TaxID=2306993 RepID=A0A443J2I1_9RHOB|nr:DUF533 domain-containing protein [Sinirhodobacter populi]RWR14684.1 tellurite resistance TerB family protein [Sinirhodobacter populi]